MRQLKIERLSKSDKILAKRPEIIRPRNSESLILIYHEDAFEVVGHGIVDVAELKILSAETSQGLKATLNELAASGNYSQYAIRGYVYAVVGYVKITQAGSFTPEGLDSFRTSLRKGNSRFFLDLRCLLRHVHNFGYTGVSPEVLRYLDSVGGSHINQCRGRKIRSGNPEEGWYSDQEHADLIDVYWHEYDIGLVSVQGTLGRLLTAQYARRPIQLANLKVEDIKTAGEENGVTGPRINFPGAKFGGAGFRTGPVETHILSDDLLFLCELQINETIAAFESHLETELPQDIRNGLPLFFNANPAKFLEQVGTARRFESFTSKLSSRFLHLSSNYMSRMLIRRTGIPVISHRTGRELVEGAYRMRYTRPRQLARMGMSRADLIYWMGHNSLVAIDSYYDDPAEDARMLDEATADIMGPIAQAFRGTLRKDASECVRGDDPTSRIELDCRKESAVGGCGSFGECHANVPIPCYRCRHFQPWVNAPHGEVLQSLLDRQITENSVARQGMGRNLLNPIQLDRDINAVKLVIRLCQEYRSRTKK